MHTHPGCDCPSPAPALPFTRAPSHTACRYKEETRGFGWYDWLAWFIPIFGWVRTYQIRKWLLVSNTHDTTPSSPRQHSHRCPPHGLLAAPVQSGPSPRRVLLAGPNPSHPPLPLPLPPRQSDFVAGLSVAAMVIPQGMSYASGLAGLPSVYGLYGEWHAHAGLPARVLLRAHGWS